MESNISPYMDEINRQMLSVLNARVSPRKGEDRKKERRGEQRERVCMSVGIMETQVFSVGPQRDREVKRLRTKTETGFV